MKRAAALLAVASVAGCVTPERPGVPAAPGTTAAPGLEDAPLAEDAERGALPDAVESMQAAPSPRSPDDWSFSLTPFLWAAGVTITTTENGISQLSDASADEVLWDLNAALMLHAEARRGRFFTFAEFVWFDLEADVNAVRPSPGAGIRVDGDVQVEQLLALFVAGWRFLEAPLDCDDARRVLALDAYGGARLTKGSVDAHADLTAPGGATGTIGGTVRPGWWDPVLGMRAVARVMPSLDVSARLEFGGFGVGAERTVLVKLGADCGLTETTSVEVGWLVYASHYEQGGDVDPFVFKEKLSGPYVAFTFRF
jgi:hypothetical protein